MITTATYAQSATSDTGFVSLPTLPKHYAEPEVDRNSTIPIAFNATTSGASKL